MYLKSEAKNRRLKVLKWKFDIYKLSLLDFHFGAIFIVDDFRQIKPLFCS